MRGLGVGHLLFALGFVVEGAIGLAAHEFLLSQQPVPDGLPWRGLLACISAALMLLPGVGLLLARTARVSALVLTAFMLFWVLVLQLPRAIAHPGNEAYWLGVGEVTTLTTGGWLIYCAIAARNDATVRIARTLFGLALIPIGLSHFVYLQSAVNLIPSWFPLRAPLTCISGAGHIMAGLAIVLGVVPRLAATLEAVMESLFTLICWVSAVVTTPTNRQDWVNLFISTALTGAGWAIADSYRRMPWALVRRSSFSPGSAGA
jgi:uncharacterized membrane protein